jgi:hypothetical protein
LFCLIPLDQLKQHCLDLFAFFKIINYESSLYFAPQYGQLTLP